MKKKYEQGFSTIIDNSKSLYDVAEKSAERGQYGIACSLMILSAEESIKAAMCAMKFNDPDAQLENWDEVFKFHKIKHQHIKGALIALHVKKIHMNEFRDEIRSRIKNLTAGTHLDPEEQEIAFYEQLNKSIKIERIDTSPEIDPSEVLEWWNHADNLKQKGLYVGREGEKWNSPSEIPISQFNDAKRFTNLLIALSEELMELYKMHHIPNYN